MESCCSGCKTHTPITAETQTSVLYPGGTRGVLHHAGQLSTSDPPHTQHLGCHLPLASQGERLARHSEEQWMWNQRVPNGNPSKETLQVKSQVVESDPVHPHRHTHAFSRTLTHTYPPPAFFITKVNLNCQLNSKPLSG